MKSGKWGFEAPATNGGHFGGGCNPAFNPTMRAKLREMQAFCVGFHYSAAKTRGLIPITGLGLESRD